MVNMATKQEIIDYLNADPTRSIPLVSFKGVECYNAPEPIGSGVLRGSIIEELKQDGVLVLKGSCYKLA